jgi:long-subunit acyl-CoA synthetase (AMP-forming)
VKKPVQSLPLTELLEKAKNKSSEYESSIKPDDLSMIIFTSGTTGFPKGGAIALGASHEEFLVPPHRDLPS